MASDRLSIRLSPKLRRGLAKLRKATGKSESELVRIAIEKLCEERQAMPTCYDVARRLGRSAVSTAVSAI